MTHRRAWACLGYRIHGVTPTRPLLEAIPIRRPAEVGRVDVRGQALLEPMQLIRAAEVHLAAQYGLITGAAHEMCEGRHLRGKFRGVVVRADGRDLAAAQEGKAR